MVERDGELSEDGDGRAHVVRSEKMYSKDGCFFKGIA